MDNAEIAQMAAEISAGVDRRLARLAPPAYKPKLVLTKPPPPPPKFERRSPLPDRVGTAKSFKQLDHYQLPMSSEFVPAWLQVLRNVGYPTDVVVLDFETYFDEEYHMGRAADALSTIEFVMDPRFEVLGLSRTIVTAPFPDYEASTHFEVGEETVAAFLKYLQGRYGDDLRGCTVVIQNAAFDATVLARRYGIFPTFGIDTLALARHWNSRQSHGLETLAKQHKLPEKGDTEEFRGLTVRRRYTKSKSRKKGPKLPIQRPIATEDQIKRLAGYANNDAMREWEIFTILLPRLSNPKTELRLAKHTLELLTKPVLRVDDAYGRDLIQQYQAAVDQTLTGIGHTQEEISGNKSFEWLLCEALRAAGENPQDYFKPMKKGYQLAIAKDDDERDVLLNHPDPRVSGLMAARVAIKSWPLHISRVKRIMAQAAANGGVLPVPLKYCGAHTGRWSGGEGINLQNLAKKGLLALIRGMLMAAAGHVLGIVDAAAIEARILAWVAGQWDLVDKFANNEEIYCGFATKVLGWPVRKPKKEGSPGYIKTIEDRHTWARNAIGKIGVLGCGYGMGAFEPGSDKSRPNYLFADAGLDIEMSEKIVTTYRSTNTAIVQFWHDIEKAFIYTAKYKKACSLPRGLRFDSTKECDVILTLPNGREIKYAEVRIESGDRSDKAAVYNNQEHKWEYLWGGTLTENVVQAMARDVLAEAMLRLEDLGYHTAFHVHDEVVMHIPIEQGKAAVAAAIVELSRVPAWAPRMPLGAEGSVSERYKKG